MRSGFREEGFGLLRQGISLVFHNRQFSCSAYGTICYIWIATEGAEGSGGLVFESCGGSPLRPRLVVPDENELERIQGKRERERERERTYSWMADGREF
jgi:hypothetical protein